jgi:hypothetical protein
MTKWCVLPDEVGNGRYIIGTLPNDGGERECISSGGRVEDDSSGGCGSTTAAGDAAQGLRPMNAAVLFPIQAVRAQLPNSDFLRDVAHINHSAVFTGLVRSDSDFNSSVQDLVGVVSQYAVNQLAGDERALRHTRYSDELHRLISELADRLRSESSDDEFTAAVDRVTSALEARIGDPIGALIEWARASSSAS